jgi:hypothetical protein
MQRAGAHGIPIVAFRAKDGKGHLFVGALASAAEVAKMLAEVG